jgi:hypothetical protein
LPVKGCKKKKKTRRSRPLSREGSICFDTGLDFFSVSSEGPPHSVAFYDSQGDEEDLFLTRIFTSQNRCAKSQWRIQGIFKKGGGSPLSLIFKGGSTIVFGFQRGFHSQNAFFPPILQTFHPVRIWVRIDPLHPLCVVRGD